MLLIFSANCTHFQTESSPLHPSRSVIFNIYKATGVRTEVNCINFEQNRETHFATACTLFHGPLVICLILQWLFGTQFTQWSKTTDRNTAYLHIFGTRVDLRSTSISEVFLSFHFL